MSIAFLPHHIWWYLTTLSGEIPLSKIWHFWQAKISNFTTYSYFRKMYFLYLKNKPISLNSVQTFHLLLYTPALDYIEPLARVHVCKEITKGQHDLVEQAYPSAVGYKNILQSICPSKVSCASAIQHHQDTKSSGDSLCSCKRFHFLIVKELL